MCSLRTTPVLFPLSSYSPLGRIHIPSDPSLWGWQNSQSVHTLVVTRAVGADYASRRSGQQEENLRRRENYHQQALSARMVQRDARDDGQVVRARSTRSTTYAHATRRRGRPAHLRSPDDSPLRDGNRDRLIGMLTQRAAKTLEYYFMETNLTYHSWLQVCPPHFHCLSAPAKRDL